MRRGAHRVLLPSWPFPAQLGTSENALSAKIEIDLRAIAIEATTRPYTVRVRWQAEAEHSRVARAGPDGRAAKNWNLLSFPGVRRLRSEGFEGYAWGQVGSLQMFRRALRVALWAALISMVMAKPWAAASALAKGDDDEEESDDDSSSDASGDDDDSGGESEDEGEGEGEDDEDAKDQPPLTAGGMYNIDTYPISELMRPLTMTQGILQMRAGVGVNVSPKLAFQKFGFLVDAKYGVRDNFTLFGGFVNTNNFATVEAYMGFEGALAYNFIDFRLAGRVGKPTVTEDKDTGLSKIESKYSGHIDMGFPFRYVAKPEIAIVALDTFLTIDFDSVPDLNPSLGVSTNPIPQVSVVVFAQMNIPNFRFDANTFIIPATARVQFSPNRRFDLGGEFRVGNVKPPEGQKIYDNLFLTLYGTLRF